MRMTIPQAVAAFNQDGTKKKMTPERLRKLLREGRVPGHVDPVMGIWFVTELRVLPAWPTQQQATS